MALEQDVKYRLVHTQVSTLKRIFMKAYKQIKNFPDTKGLLQITTDIPLTCCVCCLDLIASHFIIRFVVLCLAAVFLFLSCRHSSSSNGSSSSLQLKPCVVEKQASLCGEIACLEWEGACWFQRSQSEHANSSWPSHMPCWQMLFTSVLVLSPHHPLLPAHWNFTRKTVPALPVVGTCCILTARVYVMWKSCVKMFCSSIEGNLD